ncbi:MAG TPA: nucleoside triphosphate hydrolase [Sphingopyxis sp.]|nr:nucleoside triphosphate hydrolase [Sphingopyxis sp.]
MADHLSSQPFQLYRDRGLADAASALSSMGKKAPASALRSTPHIPLGAVIAIVGCDGSGKSTLAADLCAALAADQPVENLYLGQDSGNILRAILAIPLIGAAIGRFLVRKSQRAHADKDKSAAPDGTMALAIHLLSRWRRHKFGRMLKRHHDGHIIVADRYPQAEVAGFYFDGPGLVADEDSSAFVRALAVREQRLYEQMAAYVPTLIIRLHIDAESAHARKPDHKLAMLRDKVRVIPTLHFNAAPILELDGRDNYHAVLTAALAASRKALRSECRPDVPD